MPFYTPNHQGRVERANRELTTLLGKLYQETHLLWPQILPIALLHLRTQLQ